MAKKKSIIAGLAVAILLIGGIAAAYATMPKNQDMSFVESNRDESKPVDSTAPKPGNMAAVAADTDVPSDRQGSYTVYNQQEFESTGGTRLLFFHAPWCPQCRALEADIKQNKLATDTHIFKVDYDSNQSLRQKYGVTIQTTVVRVDGEGNLQKKYVPYNEPTLSNVLNNLL